MLSGHIGRKASEHHLLDRLIQLSPDLKLSSNKPLLSCVLLAPLAKDSLDFGLPQLSGCLTSLISCLSQSSEFIKK
jgi:hypothetical protein